MPVVVCTECDTKMKIPDEVLGKKIRCKACKAVFLAQEPVSSVVSEKPKAGPPPLKKQAPPTPAAVPPIPLSAAEAKAKQLDEELGGDQNPYTLNKDDDGALPRCPFCAKELASETAVICLSCGYNTVTRLRFETKAVYQPTTMEWVSHLAPPFLGILAMIALITGQVIVFLKLGSWMQETFFYDEDKKKLIVKPAIFSGWLCVFVAFALWKIGKLVYKRLVWDFRPPEKKIIAGEE